MRPDDERALLMLCCGPKLHWQERGKGAKQRPFMETTWFGMERFFKPGPGIPVAKRLLKNEWIRKVDDLPGVEVYTISDKALRLVDLSGDVYAKLGLRTAA